jgi:Asp/Glu/hydantoin racemase
MARILVVNPNSSHAVTQAMDACLGSVRSGVAHEISCDTLEKSPLGIESDAHVLEVVPHILERIQGSRADAYVIACFSDPGLMQARAMTPKPVVGIAEAAYCLALGYGRRFGVLSILEASIPRHRNYIRALGLSERFSGDRAIGLGVSQLHGGEVMERIIPIVTALRDQDRSDAIILGCAGLGAYRADLERSMGIPVIDPVQAGALLACSMVTLCPTGEANRRPDCTSQHI